MLCVVVLYSFANYGNSSNQTSDISQGAQGTQPSLNPSPTPTNTSMPTPTDTPTPTPNIIATPTNTDVQAAVTSYYNNTSYWAGQRVIKQIDNVTYESETGTSSQPKLTVCVRYEFANISSPDVTADTTQRYFYLEYNNDSWTVTNMGDWMSC